MCTVCENRELEQWGGQRVRRGESGEKRSEDDGRIDTMGGTELIVTVVTK